MTTDYKLLDEALEHLDNTMNDTVPLPEPHGSELYCGHDLYSYTRGRHHPNHGGFYLYTANQLRAYGDACRKDEREKCAKVCDELGSVTHWGKTAASSIRAMP